ncbi:hypothetical protein KR009_011525 [Drosophila setifemur]|nr:hypothetical protein KR009_011525 [Drosophila setifemur]
MSAAGNDYAELCDLGPSRWSARPYGYHANAASAGLGLGPSGGGGSLGGLIAGATQSSSSMPTGGSAGLSAHHMRGSAAAGPSSYEAEDIGLAFGMISPPPGSGPYGGMSAAAAGGSRVGNSTSSLRAAGGRSGLYYSPPGTSYTIIERPHSPHYYYNSAGVPTKGGSLPGRGSAYLSSSPASHMAAGTAGTLPTSTAASGRSMGQHSGSNGNKKRPISPEQVLRMFGAGATQSSSVPTSSYHYSNGGTRDRDRDRTGRRSPASSPPSTTHQIYRDRERERDRSVPNIHELTTRTVSMSRDQQIDHGFGICVKGGKDSGLGVYISRIEENSVAERAGLRPGDTILEVNGTPFTSINHEEALKRCVQILKSSRQISMTVRAPPTLNSNAPLHGFGPPSRDPMYASMAPNLHPQNQAAAAAAASGAGLPFRQTCSWMDRHGRPASPPMEYGGRRSERRDRIRRVELLIEPGQSLGLMIRGGVEYGLGIFVTGVDKDSVADRAGLMIGDEILEVNGQSFLDVTHDEAVGQLKYHKRMSLVIRDVGKVPHSCTSIEMEPWDAYSPTGTRWVPHTFRFHIQFLNNIPFCRARRKGQIATMVEEKARSLLPRHHFASLSYYIAEYSAKAMTIDAFVAVLLEMLDTYEKHTLVTEIRELVFPEDRTRYDELVYRRDRDPYSVDRHRRKGDPARDLPVTADDLEIIAATGRSPSSDSGLGMTVTDIHKRPAQQLPHRPMSAGPILHRSQPASHYQAASHQSSSSLSPPQQQQHQQQQHQQQQHQQQQPYYPPHHASLRHLGGSSVGSGRHHHLHQLGPSQLRFKQAKDHQQQEYGCDEHRTRRGSETHLPEYEQDAVSSSEAIVCYKNQ